MALMNLYLLDRTDDVGYSEFDSMVVAARSEEEALTFHPYNGMFGNDWKDTSEYPSWTTPEYITITQIGTTKYIKRSSVVITSFNAG